MENAKGTAEMQADLAKSKVGVDIRTNDANARTAEARGEAEFILQTGTARGAEVEAVGLARARGYEAQVRALGSNATTLVNVITALVDGSSKFVPDILVTSGGVSVGAYDVVKEVLSRLGTVAFDKVAWANHLAQARRWVGPNFSEPAPAKLAKQDDLPG